MEDIKWEDAILNEYGILTIAFGKSGIVGYNGFLNGDQVMYENEIYTIVMVSRLGDFGLSKTGQLPYSLRVSPTAVTHISIK